MISLRLPCGESRDIMNASVLDLNNSVQSVDLARSNYSFPERKQSQQTRYQLIRPSEPIPNSTELFWESINESRRKRVSLLNVDYNGYIFSGVYQYLFNAINSSFYPFLTEDLNSSYTVAMRKLDSLRQHIEKIENTTDLPAKEAVEDAKSFIETNLRRYGMVIPKIRTISGGEINFYWDNNEVILDVAIFGDGTFSYYSKVKSDNLECCDDKGIFELLPEILLEKLRVK